jgi:hypothetical protein
LKHNFCDFVEVAFWMTRVQKMISQGLSTTWNIASSSSNKLHFKTSRMQIMSSQSIHLLETTLPQLHPSSIFWMPRMKKLCSHGLSTPWNNASSTLPKSRMNKMISQAYFKHHFREFVQFDLDAQEVENDVAWPFDTLKHRFIDITKVEFQTSRRQLMSSQGQSST